MGALNVIPTRLFKNAHHIWGKMQYPHYDLNPHYMWEPSMQYLHDNLKMHTICGGKMQYPHYDLNPHYIWVAKCNIGIMTLNPHYLWEAKMLNP